MVCSAFLPSIGEVTQKAQPNSFEKSKLEKRSCKNWGFNDYN